jgi:hypothetical protein
VRRRRLEDQPKPSARHTELAETVYECRVVRVQSCCVPGRTFQSCQPLLDTPVRRIAPRAWPCVSRSHTLVSEPATPPHRQCHGTVRVVQTLSGFGGLTRVLVHPQVTWVGLGRCDAGDVGELAILDLGVRLSSRTWGLEVRERGWSSGERSRGDVGDGDTGRYALTREPSQLLHARLSSSALCE